MAKRKITHNVFKIHLLQTGQNTSVCKLREIHCVMKVKNTLCYEVRNTLCYECQKYIVLRRSEIHYVTRSEIHCLTKVRKALCYKGLFTPPLAYG